MVIMSVFDLDNWLNTAFSDGIYLFYYYLSSSFIISWSNIFIYLSNLLRYLFYILSLLLFYSRGVGFFIEICFYIMFILLIL